MTYFGRRFAAWSGRLLLLTAAITALATVACGDGPTRLTLDDSGGRVELSSGETFEVVLDGNPTTGYSWIVESGDPSVVEVTGEPAFEPESDLIGAGGKFTFVFEARAPGTTTLTLEYRRSFETAPPEKVFSVTVTVD